MRIGDVVKEGGSAAYVVARDLPWDDACVPC